MEQNVTTLHHEVTYSNVQRLQMYDLQQQNLVFQLFS